MNIMDKCKAGKDTNHEATASTVDYRYLMDTLQSYSERYPFIGIGYVGTSVLGRGIPMVTLGDSCRTSRSVLYIGCHHAMEWITSAVLLRFIGEYCNSYVKDGRMYGIKTRHLCRSRTIRVIPQLNVDGADIQINGAGSSILRERLISMNGGDDFTHWQANARGVDLNHNYDSGFSEYKQKESEYGILGGCPSRYSGEAPESEPECAFLANLLRFSDDIKLLLTLHTQGEEIYCSGGEKIPHCMAVARRIERLTGYRLAEPEGSAAHGGLTDWYIREIKRPAFTLECGHGENPLPLADLPDIYVRLRELLFTAPLFI